MSSQSAVSVPSKWAPLDAALVFIESLSPETKLLTKYECDTATSGLRWLIELLREMNWSPPVCDNESGKLELESTTLLIRNQQVNGSNPFVGSTNLSPVSAGDTSCVEPANSPQAVKGPETSTPGPSFCAAQVDLEELIESKKAPGRHWPCTAEVQSGAITAYAGEGLSLCGAASVWQCLECGIARCAAHHMRVELPSWHDRCGGAK